MTEAEAKHILENDSCYECSYGVLEGATNCRNTQCNFARATNLAINALEKQIAEKVGNIDDSENHFRLSEKGFLLCVDTNKEIRYPLISLKDLDYCPRCGQKLDWSEV